MSNRIPVTVLGATGSVGQRFIQLLDGHPYFEVIELTGSKRSVGQPYAQACHWILEQDMPEWAKEMIINESSPETTEALVAFSALPSSVAWMLEPEYASNGIMVCSNASAYRDEPDVPLLMPEINPDHIEMLAHQRTRRAWKGGIVTNPNCTSAGPTVVLKALNDSVGVRNVFAVSLQALSGAGLPGVSAIDIIDNVIPYIGGEEDKVSSEPRKMLGKLEGDTIKTASIEISAHTNRVPVRDGHLVCLSIQLHNPLEIDEARHVLENYQAPIISRNLPSTPQPVIQVLKQEDRPQPRLDRMIGNGMTTVVGRLRLDPIWHIKMVVLSHNTIRGAAGGSIFNAELLFKEGWLG